MASYTDNGTTAMIIFAKATTKTDVETPNTINPNGSDTPFNPPTPNTPNIPTDDISSANNTFSGVKQVVVGLGVFSAVKSVANYYKNNYGDIMQDSNKQAEINEAMNILSMGASIGLGFAYGGVIGGVASIIANGVNVGLQTASFQRQMHRNQVQSEIMMARTQYASINGGR